MPVYEMITSPVLNLNTKGYSVDSLITFSPIITVTERYKDYTGETSALIKRAASE